MLRELIASQWCNEKSSQANAWATSESSTMRWTRANSPRSITSATPWSRLGATFSARLEARRGGCPIQSTIGQEGSQDTRQDGYPRRLLPSGHHEVAPIRDVASPRARRAKLRGHPHPRWQLSRRHAGLHPRGGEQIQGHGGELPTVAETPHRPHY